MEKTKPITGLILLIRITSKIGSIMNGKKILKNFLALAMIELHG